MAKAKKKKPVKKAAKMAVKLPTRAKGYKTSNKMD